VLSLGTACDAVLQGWSSRLSQLALFVRGRSMSTTYPLATTVSATGELDRVACVTGRRCYE
jgi:hypothetical protein